MNILKNFIKKQKRKASKQIKMAKMYNNHPSLQTAMRKNATEILKNIDLLPELLEELVFVPPAFIQSYNTAVVDAEAFELLYALDCILQNRRLAYAEEFSQGDCYIYGNHMGIKMSDRPDDYISLATIIPVEYFYNKYK